MVEYTANLDALALINWVSVDLMFGINRFSTILELNQISGVSVSLYKFTIFVKKILASARIFGAEKGKREEKKGN